MISPPESGVVGGVGVTVELPSPDEACPISAAVAAEVPAVFLLPVLQLPVL